MPEVTGAKLYKFIMSCNTLKTSHKLMEKTEYLKNDNIKVGHENIAVPCNLLTVTEEKHER
jgi:hypothetical protein